MLDAAYLSELGRLLEGGGVMTFEESNEELETVIVHRFERVAGW